MASFVARIQGRVWRDLAGFAIIGLSSVLYIWLAWQSPVLGGDNGEFVALARSPGVAHPPGYPLYVAYLRLAASLPGTAAQSAALATALLGSLQLIILYLAIRYWGASSWAASLALAVFSTGYLSLAYSTHAEVFCLNNLLVAALLLVASPLLRLGGQTRLALLGLLIGMGLAHHQTSVFVLPIAGAACLGVLKRAEGAARARAACLLLASFLLGLSPYLLLLTGFSAGQEGLAINLWPPAAGGAGLVRHVLRLDYGFLSLDAGSRDVNLPLHLRWLWSSVYGSLHLLLPFVVLGFYSSLCSPPLGRGGAVMPRLYWVLLLGCLLVSGPLFVSRFNMENPAVAERFHLLPVMLASIPGALGLDHVSQMLARFQISLPVCRWNAVWRNCRGWAVVVFVWLFGLQIGLRRTEALRRPDLELALRNGLVGIPRGSLLFVRGDHLVFGYSALQSAYGLRRDVLIVNPGMLAAGWYQDAVFKRIGLGKPNRLLSVQECLSLLMAHAFHRQTPVYAHPLALPNDLAPDRYDYGLFRRLVPSAEAIPPAETIFAVNKRLFSTYQMPATRSLATDYWSTLAQMLYTRTWLSIAESLPAASQAPLRNQALDMARRYGPCFCSPCER